MILKNNDECKKTSLESYKSVADAFLKEIDVILLERNYIRKTLSNEMDYLLEFKDNEIAKREIRLFNEIISRIIKDDRKGEEILYEYGFKRECTKIN